MDKGEMTQILVHVDNMIISRMQDIEKSLNKNREAMEERLSAKIEAFKKIKEEQHKEILRSHKEIQRSLELIKED